MNIYLGLLLLLCLFLDIARCESFFNPPNSLTRSKRSLPREIRPSLSGRFLDICLCSAWCLFFEPKPWRESAANDWFCGKCYRCRHKSPTSPPSPAPAPPPAPPGPPIIITPPAPPGPPIIITPPAPAPSPVIVVTGAPPAPPGVIYISIPPSGYPGQYPGYPTYPGQYPGYPGYYPGYPGYYPQYPGYPPYPGYPGAYPGYPYPGYPYPAYPGSYPGHPYPYPNLPSGGCCVFTGDKWNCVSGAECGPSKRSANVNAKDLQMQSIKARNFWLKLPRTKLRKRF